MNTNFDFSPDSGDSGASISTEPKPEVLNAPVVETEELKPGQIVADCYRVVDFLGSGGMSSVYKVFNIPMQKTYALKALSVHKSKKSFRRFHKEARAIAALDHANIVRVHAFGSLDQGQPYMILDYLDGETLSHRLKKSGVLPVEQVIKLATQVCFGLAYAHRKGIIHRDLKPGNIVLCHSDTHEHGEVAKIIDFGLAKFMGMHDDENTPLTEHGAVFGTPLYMSPEQCLSAPVDNRTDVYSLGCVMFECLTGTPPFSGGTPLQIMMRHKSHQPPDLKEASLGRHYPAELERVIEKALAKDPNDRYPDCLQLAQDLLALQLHEIEAESERQSTEKAALRKSSTAERTKIASTSLAAVILGFLLLLGVAALALVSYSQMSASVTQGSAESPIPQKHALTQIADFSTINGNEKTFLFPYDESLVEVFYRKNGTGIWTRIKPNLPHILPVDTKFSILASAEFCEKHAAAFRLFRSDEVARIQFTGIRGKYSIDDPDLARTFDEALTHLNHFRSLRSFDTNGAPVTGKALANMDLGHMTSLVSLILLDSMSTGDFVSQSQIVKTLKELSVSGVEDGVKVIPHVRDVESLNLYGTNARDDDLKPLAQLKNLKSLSLRNNPHITDRALAYLERVTLLRELYLGGCSITPAAIDKLALMKNLRVLDLSVDSFSKDDVSRLRQAMPRTCKIEHNENLVYQLINERFEKPRAEGSQVRK